MEPKVTDWIPIDPPTIEAWISELRTLDDAQLLVRLRLTFSALEKDSAGWSKHWTAVENEVLRRKLTD
jgi:hypothetical protein